jgi:putative hydrolase of HD superfamily
MTLVTGGADGFTDDDIAFIKRIGARNDYFPGCPDIIANFVRYQAMAPKLRQGAALDDLKNTRRTGWVFDDPNLPKPESVYDHSIRLCTRIDQYAPTTTSEQEIAHMKDLALVHDLSEALVGDFPPTNIILSEDKKRLEGLAARVVFASDANRYALYQEYEGKSTASAQLVSDIDKIDALEVALVYEGRYPNHDAVKGMYHDFRRNIVDNNRLKTGFGHYLLQQLDKHADDIRQSATPQNFFGELIQGERDAERIASWER